MLPEPAIRGAVLRQSIEWLGSLIVARRTSPHALGVRLEDEDFALFTHAIEADAWYPIDSSARIDGALILAHGGGREAVMAELGARRARQLLASQPCPLDQLAIDRQQLDPAELMRRLPILNFGRWRCVGRSLLDFTLELEGARPLPESTRFQIQGFLQAVARDVMGARARVRSRRASVERTTFRGSEAPAARSMEGGGSIARARDLIKPLPATPP